MDNALLKLFTKKDRVPTILPIGYPGLKLMNYNIKETVLDANKQYNVMKALTEEFDLDVIFNFMELSVEAEALGATVAFEEYINPSIRVHPIKTVEDIDNIKIPDPKTDGRMATFIKSMKLMDENLPQPKIACINGPFTLAGEMMNVTDALMATMMDKDFLEKLLEVTTETLDRYIKAYIEAGAEIILICEPTCSMLPPSGYEEFSGRYTKKLFDNNKEAIPTLHICGDTRHILDKMVATGAQGLSFDSIMDLPETAAAMPPNVAVIGNIDPVRVLNQEDPQIVTDSVLELKKSMADYPNFVLMPGCDLPYTVPLENIHAFINASKN